MAKDGKKTIHASGRDLGFTLCGIDYYYDEKDTEFTLEIKEVTCKKCLRIIKDRKIKELE